MIGQVRWLDDPDDPVLEAEEDVDERHVRDAIDVVAEAEALLKNTR